MGGRNEVVGEREEKDEGRKRGMRVGTLLTNCEYQTSQKNRSGGREG